MRLLAGKEIDLPTGVNKVSRTSSLKTAVLWSIYANVSPNIILSPFPTGNNCEVIFDCPHAIENNADLVLPNTLSFFHNLLSSYEDLSRLQRACLVSWREFEEGGHNGRV